MRRGVVDGEDKGKDREEIGEEGMGKKEIIKEAVKMGIIIEIKIPEIYYAD